MAGILTANKPDSIKTGKTVLAKDTQCTFLLAKLTVNIRQSLIPSSVDMKIFENKNSKYVH